MPVIPVTAAELHVEIGTIFYRSWGYDQTNVDFYQVVGISASGKSVRLRPVKQAVQGRGVVARKGHWFDSCKHCHQSIRAAGTYYVHNHNNESACHYGSGFAEPEIFTKRLQRGYHGEASTAFNSFSSLSLWDGTPQYDTRALGYEGH